MAVLLYVLTVLLVHGQQASGQGVSLELNGTVVPNFGLLLHSDIDTNDEPEIIGGNLVCRTDLTPCCRNSDGMSQGNWYYPTGAVVLFASGDLPSGQIYRMRRGPQVVRLRRVGSANITTAIGLYRCELADQNGTMQTRYVGLYTEGDGVVSISQAPQFSLISADPLEFTLTSTTTGGPPTSVFWTLPNTAMATGDPTLLNGVNAIVRHTLTSTERMPGVYMFSTTNARSGAPVSSSITVQAANPPTGLMAVQDGLTSIRVTWTAPAPGGATVTGYRIFYQTGGDSVQSVDVGAGATIHTLTGLQSGATYSILIVTLSNQLPSARAGHEVVMVEVFEDPTVMAQPQDSTSIRVTFTQPSGSLATESYDIQYTRVTGAGQTLCDSVEDTGATTDVQSPFTITNLEEFSSYDITVTARAFSTMRTTTEQAMTLPAAPSGPPQSVITSSVTSSSITVQWGRVSCIDRNSEITGYTVRYGKTGSATPVMESVSGTSASDRMFSASGLIPRTSYTFEVAAVSSEGTGPFSTGTTVETTLSEGIALHLSGQRYGNNSLVTLTAIGEGDTAALLCLTDRVQCCRGSDGGAGGNWYYPNNGSLVPFGFEIPMASIYQNRGASRVQLNRRNNAQSPTGVYRCEVPDASGTNQRIYVGVTNVNSEGFPTISTIQFELTSATNAATPSFTLNCITAGGPVDFSDITWTRAGSSLPANHGLFQVLDDGSTATYNNTLAVTGRETGQYTCRLQPPGGTLITRPITVEAANPPTGQTAVQDGLTSILLSWTAPASGGASHTGYRISYQTGGIEQSVDVGAGATSYTLTGLQSGATYSISIVALSNTLPSTVVGPETVIIEEREAPTVMTSVLDPTSIRVTFSASNAESYDIQYTRVVGPDQQLCPDNEDTMTASGVASPYDITNLQEFSSYDITVTAVFPGPTMIPAATVRETTSAAAPAAAPRDLVSTTVLSTSITVGWDPVECIERNGVIHNYIVRFGPEGGVQSESTIQSGGIGVAGTYTASGLTPFTRYSFEVTAVNSAGTGPFTAPLIVETARNSSNTPVNVASPSQSPTSITLSWEQPAGDFIENYVIVYTYQGGCSDYTQPENMATVNDGTAREYTLQNLQEFSGYAITVTAVNTGGGSTSDMITATTMADAPSGPPQSVMTSSVTSSSITVQWGRVSCIDRNSEITGYTVRYGQTGSATTVMESVSGTGNSDRVFTASGLIPRTSYTFEVAAVSSEGTAPFSTGTTVETPAPDVPVPDPPVVTLGVVTATTVTLSWSPQPGVGQYEVHYVRAVGAQQHGACPDFIDTLNTEATTENSLTVAGLQEFSTYTVTVFAVSNAGRVPSEEVVITTPETVPAPPRGVEVVNFTDTAITVHWEPLECIDINSQFEITGYTVRYGFVTEPGISTEISSSLSVRTINVLYPGVEYLIAVATVNSNGETGGFSNRIIQTTSGGQSPGSAGGTETATVAAASVVVVLVVLILAVSGVVIAVLVLKHRRGAPPLTQQPPTEAMVLTTFPESTKPPAAISTGPNAAYQTVASGGRGQSQGNDGDHTYEYIVPPGLQSRDQPEPPHVYEST